MRTLKYTFWQEGEFFLGHLNDYPDYATQAYSKEELFGQLEGLANRLGVGRSPIH